MRIKAGTLKRILTVMLLAITVFVITLAVSEFVKYKEAKEISSQEEIKTINTNIETVLVVGLDKYSEQINTDSTNVNDQLADFNLLLVLDKLHHTVTPIMINRDTICEYDEFAIGGAKAGTAKGQLALSHTSGTGKEDSLINTKNAISNLFNGIKIDYYLQFTMDAVAIVNDCLGGVEVVVMDDFTGVDDSLKQGETVLLVGEHSLNYVRSRKGLDNPTNIDRMSRQNQYLHGLYEKACIEYRNDSSVFSNVLKKVGDCLISNCSIYDISDLLRDITDYELQSVIIPSGESRQGDYMEFYIDEESIKKVCELVS